VYIAGSSRSIFRRLITCRVGLAVGASVSHD